MSDKKIFTRPSGIARPLRDTSKSITQNNSSTNNLNETINQNTENSNKTLTRKPSTNKLVKTTSKKSFEDLLSTSKSNNPLTPPKDLVFQSKNFDSYATPPVNRKAKGIFSKNPTNTSNLIINELDVNIYWQPIDGDLVWARTSDNLPYAPACICPPELFNSSLNIISKSSTAKNKKYTVYLYGTDVFDFVTIHQLKPYNEENRLLNCQQVIPEESVLLFNQAIKLIEIEEQLNNTERIDKIKSKLLVDNYIDEPQSNISIDYLTNQTSENNIEVLVVNNDSDTLVDIDLVRADPDINKNDFINSLVIPPINEVISHNVIEDLSNNNDNFVDNIEKFDDITFTETVHYDMEFSKENTKQTVSTIVNDISELNNFDKIVTDVTHLVSSNDVNAIDMEIPSSLTNNIKVDYFEVSLSTTDDFNKVSCDNDFKSNELTNIESIGNNYKDVSFECTDNSFVVSTEPHYDNQNESTIDIISNPFSNGSINDEVINSSATIEVGKSCNNIFDEGSCNNDFKSTEFVTHNQLTNSITNISVESTNNAVVNSTVPYSENESIIDNKTYPFSNISINDDVINISTNIKIDKDYSSLDFSIKGQYPVNVDQHNYNEITNSKEDINSATATSSVSLNNINNKIESSELTTEVANKMKPKTKVILRKQINGLSDAASLFGSNQQVILPNSSNQYADSFTTSSNVVSASDPNKRNISSLFMDENNTLTSHQIFPKSTASSIKQDASSLFGSHAGLASIEKATISIHNSTAKLDASCLFGSHSSIATTEMISSSNSTPKLDDASSLFESNLSPSITNNYITSTRSVKGDASQLFSFDSSNSNDSFNKFNNKSSDYDKSYSDTSNLFGNENFAFKNPENSNIFSYSNSDNQTSEFLSHNHNSTVSDSITLKQTLLENRNIDTEFNSYHELSGNIYNKEKTEVEDSIVENSVIVSTYNSTKATVNGNPICDVVNNQDQGNRPSDNIEIHNGDDKLSEAPIYNGVPTTTVNVDFFNSPPSSMHSIQSNDWVNVSLTDTFDTLTNSKITKENHGNDDDSKLIHSISHVDQLLISDASNKIASLSIQTNLSDASNSPRVHSSRGTKVISGKALLKTNASPFEYVSNTNEIDSLFSSSNSSNISNDFVLPQPNIESKKVLQPNNIQNFPSRSTSAPLIPIPNSHFQRSESNIDEVFSSVPVGIFPVESNNPGIFNNPPPVSTVKHDVQSYPPSLPGIRQPANPITTKTTSANSKSDNFNYKKDSKTSEMVLTAQGYIPMPAGVTRSKSIPVNNIENAKSTSIESTKNLPNYSKPLSFTQPNVTPNKNHSRGPQNGCPLVCIGFNGRIVTMIPEVQLSINFLNSSNPYLNTPLKIYYLFDLVKESSSKMTSIISQTNPTPFYDPSGQFKLTNELDITTTEIEKRHYEELRLFVEVLSTFPGPLITSSSISDIKSKNSKFNSAIVNVSSYIKKFIETPISSRSNQSRLISSERTLWKVLDLLVKSNGMISSSEASLAGKPHSPEFSIIKILLDSCDVITTNEIISNISNSSMTELTSLFRNVNNNSNNVKENIYIEIENYLLVGERELALELAVSNKVWPLALIISSICGPKVYQDVIREYTVSCLPQGTPLTLLSHIYSNQGINQLKKRQPLNQTIKSNDHPSNISIYWRRNLSSILSNKSLDWDNLALSLGDKIYDETNDIYAAHITYLASLCLPSSPKSLRQKSASSNKRYCLLGCDLNHALVNNFSDISSLSSLRMTEILEFSLLMNMLVNNNSPNSKSSSSLSIGKSISGLFGFSSNENANPISNSTSIVTSNIHISSEQLTSVKVALVPIKLRLAYLLADYGLLTEAYEYVVAIKDIVSYTGSTVVAPSKPPLKLHHDSSSSNQSKPFSSRILKDLDDLFDRISVTLNKSKVVVSSAPPSKLENSINTISSQESKSNSSSNWGINSIVNVLSSSKLKEFVDGGDSLSTIPSQIPPNSNIPPVYPISKSTITNSINNVSISRNSSGSMDITNATVNSHNNFPPIPNNSYSPVSSAPSSTNGNSYSLYPPSAPGTKAPVKSNSNQNFMMDSITTNQNYNSLSRPSSNQYLNSSVDQSPPTFGVNLTNSTSSLDNKLNYEYVDVDFNNQQSFAKPGTIQQPEQNLVNNSTSNLTKSEQKSTSDASSKKSQVKSPDKEKPKSSEKSSSSGIVGKARKGLLSWFYPDAVDANDNLGQGLEAYFDKDLNKWIFPGEEDSAQNDPGLAPPPTSLGPSTTINSESNSKNTLDNDPLASLMAPPSRSIGSLSSSSNKADDPMAALMAPPMRRMPYSNSTPPSSSVTPPVSTSYNVWQPPKSMVNNANTFVANIPVKAIDNSNEFNSDNISNSNNNSILDTINTANSSNS